MRRVNANFAFAVALLAVTVGCNRLRGDVIALWDFDCDSIEDSWANNHGTMRGTPYFAAGRPPAGRALELTGKEYAVIANESNFDITDAITVAAWIKVRSFNRQHQAIVTKGDTAWRIQRNSTTNALAFACTDLEIPDGTHWGSLPGSRNVNDGQWHHVAGVYDGGKMYLYVDGTLDASQNASGKIAVNDHPVCLGENSQTRERYFDGLIDEVVIFNHALDANAIAMLHIGGPSSLLTETRIDRFVKEAAQTVADLEAAEAVQVLSRKISEYDRWRQNREGKTAFRDRYISPDVYFLLARAKEAAAVPAAEAAAAYTQVVTRVPYRADHVGEALVWLSEHLAADRYEELVQEFARHSQVLSHDIRQAAGCFQERGNWGAFERFLDALFSGVDRNGEPAYFRIPAAWPGLQENESWTDKFLQYCRGRREFTPLLFRPQEKLAREYANQGNYLKAAEVYRDVVARCGPEQDKASYEYKVCECLFHANQFADAVRVLDTFISRHKSESRVLVIQAMMLKGRCCVNLGAIDEAVDTFFNLLVEYPQAEPVAEATFFMGYCLMLQQKFEDASEALGLVVRDHPTSSHAEKARLYLDRIESMTR
jgi:tetratricopeptide (TPR) repeat protein